jgi:23S rRNA (adenine2503-C2)-methyltransferase
MQYIYDLNKDELASYLAAAGEESYRVTQIYSALHKGMDINSVSNIPKSLKENLTKNFNCSLPAIIEQKKSADGTKKYLLQYKDNYLINEASNGKSLIECVLLKQDYGSTVCVSTQVGCRMGCVFCASGKDGLIRNLTAGEILAQVLLVNKYDKITNVVLMGSGEPFDNYENVIKFLRLVTNAGGINISARNISVSTSGLVPEIKKFADLKMQVNLCISLHAPNDGIRKKIMPVANRYSVQELIDAAKYFYNKTHRRVIFEYSLIDGINCSPEQGRELARLVRGFPSHINLIMLNNISGELLPPSRDTAKSFMDAVIKSGASCTMRKNRGSDIDGACGQLRASRIQRLT